MMAYACPCVVESEKRFVLGTPFHPANSAEPSFMDGEMAVRESEAHALMGLRRSSTNPGRGRNKSTHNHTDRWIQVFIHGMGALQAMNPQAGVHSSWFRMQIWAC